MIEDYPDEDLIPAFKCVVCGGHVCKDDVYQKKAGFECICIDCGYKEGKNDLDNKNKKRM